MREFLTRILSADPALEVVGAAGDPYEAREKIRSLAPDVLTLDVEMPRMDGITFLRNLMRLRPMPVVMISMLTHAGAAATLEALEIGAVDFVVKRSVADPAAMKLYAKDIAERVKAAASARVGAAQAPAGGGADVAACARARSAPDADAHVRRVVAIGASTGGTEAIRAVLRAFHDARSAVVMCQHIPSAFSRAFAERMDRQTPHEVCEARHGQTLAGGCAYLAPGNCHLRIVRRAGRLVCELAEDDKVSGHRPSVDALFASVAEAAGASAVGVLLTGMGRDGARGLARMRAAGALTIAQDEETSVVWGMPGAAVAIDAAEIVLPLHAIGPVIRSV
jgi:two-component system chemotaxis response regulator CheB